MCVKCHADLPPAGLVDVQTARPGAPVPTHSVVAAHVKYPVATGVWRQLPAAGLVETKSLPLPVGTARQRCSDGQTTESIDPVPGPEPKMNCHIAVGSVTLEIHRTLLSVPATQKPVEKQDRPVEFTF
jgi:hypothetical protein